jgi:hypothetical protein
MAALLQDFIFVERLDVRSRHRYLVSIRSAVSSPTEVESVPSVCFPNYDRSFDQTLDF